jgi:hypothetical protein
MEEEEDRVGAFGDLVGDFEHLEKAVVWLQLGVAGVDDNVKEPVCIEITEEDNLFDEICKLHPFRDWGVRVYAKRARRKNKLGEVVCGCWETEYESGWEEAMVRDNFARLQTWLLKHPSREACYIIMMTPRNSVDAAKVVGEQDVERLVTSGKRCSGSISELLAELKML